MEFFFFCLSLSPGFYYYVPYMPSNIKFQTKTNKDRIRKLLLENHLGSKIILLPWWTQMFVNVFVFECVCVCMENDAYIITLIAMKIEC